MFAWGPSVETWQPNEAPYTVYDILFVFIALTYAMPDLNLGKPSPKFEGRAQLRGITGSHPLLKDCGKCLALESRVIASSGIGPQSESVAELLHIVLVPFDIEFRHFVQHPAALRG